MNSVTQRTLYLRTSQRTVDRRVFPGRVMRIVSDSEAVLTAREGELWITFDKTTVTRPGPWGDYFLRPGQGIVLHQGDEVVLSSADARYGSALFDLVPIGGRAMPRQPSLASRLLSGIAALLPRPRGMAAA
jgi:hypothetical protein